jgi:hypothetical protein
MRLSRIAALLTMLTLTSCKDRTPVPETPMPPNTILLSGMMRALTAEHPELVEQMVAEIDKGGKQGPALLTPKLADELRKRIVGKDWTGLDRFPGWTMREINPTVRVAGHFAGKDDAIEGTAAVHPGSPAAGSPEASSPAGNAPGGADTAAMLDVGSYALDRGHEEDLFAASTLPGFTTDGIVTELGDGVTRGDGPNALAAEHAASQRLADMLNRLAANGLAGSKDFTVSAGGALATKPEQVMAELQATGHTVTVIDARYFANFGHFHFSAGGAAAQDVMMPFWVNTQIAVPGTGGFLHRKRPLLVPVSHAEYEWQVRGPQVNADVSYYFGIDGKSEWRTMDTLDQAWVLKRAAHTYTGADAVEVTRLAGLLTVAYMHQHAERPKLPFGGYYALGVCQDGVSAIEKKMTGKVTLFPNTADDALFDDARDAEVNAMIRAIPKDREGKPPEPERIFGSLPTEPGPAGQFAAITIPGLGAEVSACYAAWKDGSLERTMSLGRLLGMGLFLGSAAALGLFAAVKTRRFMERHPVQRGGRR